MSRMSRYSMESHRSSRNEGDGDGKVSDFDMKRRCNGISASDLDLNISQDPGSSTAFKTAQRLLTTLSLMDSLSSLAGEPLRSSRSNTTIVRNLISSSWTSIYHSLRPSSISLYGHSLSSKLSSGTTVIQAIRQIYGCVLTSMSVGWARLEFTSVDRGENDE